VPATAGEALQAARAQLAATSHSPLRDAQLLLAHALKVDQTALLTYPERVLSAAEASRYQSFVVRRTASEPIQYITGLQEFYGLPFTVSPHVLIPRPETEHLVEAVLERIDRDNSVRILDVGTGSGAIAVSLAHALPQALVTAVDLSPEALGVARGNAEKHGVSDRINWVQSDLLAAVISMQFDVVVSNPPYIANREVLEPQVGSYEPHSALYAGPTGLEAYVRLIPQARKVLKPNGWLLLEIGYGQSPAIRKLLSDWTGVLFLSDLQGIERVAVAKR
jgi:release factor glutamine methyltransferase